MEQKPYDKMPPGGCAGFTLIELMVALLILSLGLFSVIQLQVISVRGHAYAREQTEAYQIAMGVVEDLRARALQWVDRRDERAMDNTFQQVFPEINLINPPPASGSHMDVTDLRPLQTYLRVPIATDVDPKNAKLINVYARNPTDNTGLAGAAAAYRVHYVAFQAPLDPGGPPSNELVRVTVFVSWDNKDHGRQDTDWVDWWQGGANFWDRHMVAVTCHLGQARNW